MITPMPDMPLIPSASRRAMRAVGATLALIGARIDGWPFATGAQPGYIRPRNWRALICSTACDRPLFLAEAKDIARLTQESVLVIRLDTALSPLSYVTFDAFVPQDGEIEGTTALWPCSQQHDRRLWLIDSDAPIARLFLDDSGLHRCPSAVSLQADMVRMGAADAAAYFRNKLWGGL